jgi:uncharacterized protein with PQ loop repeat
MPDKVVLAANVCQTVIPLISLMAYLPQWGKIWSTQSSIGVSLRAWCIWTVSSSFAVFYALVQLVLNGRGWALVASSLVTLVFVLATVVLVVRFRPGAETRPDTGAANHAA